MSEYNSNTVLATLKSVLNVLEKNHVEYRIIGSAIAAAVNGKLHRNLGDIDLIIDEEKKDIVYSALQNIGYFPVRGMYEVARKYLSLETMRHKTLAEVGFFYGKRQADGGIVMGHHSVRVSVDAIALTPTKYSLHGIQFIGINPKAAATRIRSSQANPKRKKELEFFYTHGIEPLPDTFVHVTIFGIKCDWLYHLISALQNLIGMVRIVFGLSFDPWR